MIKSWKKYLIKTKCFFGKHEWHYSGRDVVERVNQGGFYRFCPHCAKKQERIIFDFGRILIWNKSNHNLTSEELRIFNLNQLGI